MFSALYSVCIHVCVTEIVDAAFVDGDDYDDCSGDNDDCCNDDDYGDGDFDDDDCGVMITELMIAIMSIDITLHFIKLTSTNDARYYLKKLQNY